MAKIGKKAKKAKRQLAELSHEELLAYTRTLRDDKKRLTEELRIANERNAILEESERHLRSQLEQKDTAITNLRDALEESQSQLQRAIDNNTKLQGVVESASANGENGFAEIFTLFGDRLFNRLDILIEQAGGEVPNDYDQGVDYSDDDADEEDEDDNLDDDDDSDDEDDSDESEHAAPANSIFAMESVDDSAPAVAVHGTAVDIGESEAEGQGEAAVSDETLATVETALTVEANANGEGVAAAVDTGAALAELVAPVVKGAVDNFKDYETVILEAVRTNALTKELALRQVVAIAYPEHAEMAEAILSSQAARDKVYEVMGL